METSKLVYSREELMRSHDYANPQVVAGRRLHGGFVPDGTYVPPRALLRSPAVDAWTSALRERGGDLLEADSSLLAGIRFPTVAQQKLLLQEGLGQTFWNNLTITGMIEARGRLLAEIEFPDFQEATDTDLSTWALGHLPALLVAHGIDEGGEPDRGVGGHDEMWFALRDLAFGETDYPMPVVPENIARPESERAFPALRERYERTIEFLLNLLMIEFRAEIGFERSERLLRDPDLFTARREEALEAAEVVDRIRTDELIHVTSLRLYLGELRALTLRTEGGGSVSGQEVVDTLWQRIVHWATVEQPPLVAVQQRELLSSRILEHAEGDRILAAFSRLDEAA